jgi:predicted AAA+ superfamily ATPase
MAIIERKFHVLIKGTVQTRDGVFDKSRRDTVLLISDLKENKINPEKFFSENYLTNGMQSLFSEAFRRFSGRSDAGVITLTQAMGGGKTHCMIALALLAKYPEMRKKVLGNTCTYDDEPVEVVAFNGRESDAPYGIWGEIADQLGKKDVFKDYYSPLQDPGQSAWTNLLKKKRLLILLDELPPYFENARSRTIGNSDLSVVSGTALSNLLVAVSKEELSVVCMVISDLKAT